VDTCVSSCGRSGAGESRRGPAPPAPVGTCRHLSAPVGTRPHQFSRFLHGFDDLQITGAPTEIAGQRFLDFLARRIGVAIEQRFGGDQNAGRAVSALRSPQIGESVLKRMQRTSRRQPLDGRHRPTIAFRSERQAGEHGLAVEQDRTGAAFAELTPVFGAGELQILPQDLE
jgi:hypothetical protein